MNEFGACSRRHFLGSFAGAALCSLVGCQRKPAGVIGPRFSLGIQSYSLRAFSLEDVITHAHALGFAHIEFYPEHFSLDSSPEEIDAMKKRMTEANMKMLGYGVPTFTVDHDANRHVFEFAKAGGLRYIAADPDPDSFDGLDQLVDEFDIRIGIHNHGPSHRYNKALDVIGAYESHDPRIGACADLGHYIRSGEDAVQVIHLLGNRLYGVHLKDFAEMKEDAKGVILGQGHLDVEGVFAALAKVDFPPDGCLSLEYEENEKDPISDIRQCLAVAQKAAAKYNG